LDLTYLVVATFWSFLLTSNTSEIVTVLFIWTAPLNVDWLVNVGASDVAFRFRLSSIFFNVLKLVETSPLRLVKLDWT
jgi:hypothetical protein